MTKTDIYFSLAIGFLVSLFFTSIANVFGVKVDDIWYLLIIIPLLSLLGLFVSSLIGKKIPVVYQLAKFLLVGSLNTMVDLGVLNLLMEIFSIYGGTLLLLSKGFSFIAAATNSYFWNKMWTFQRKDTVFEQREYIKFLLVVTGGLIINVSTVWILVDVIEVPFSISPKLLANIAALTAVVTSVMWNFFGSKFIVFKK